MATDRSKGRKLRENDKSASNLWFALGNVARGRPTRQSSTAYGGDSKRAVDGNKNPNWNGRSCTHTSRQGNPWWRVDIGNPSYKVLFPCLSHHSGPAVPKDSSPAWHSLTIWFDSWSTRTPGSYMTPPPAMLWKPCSVASFMIAKLWCNALRQELKARCWNLPRFWFLSSCIMS